MNTDSSERARLGRLEDRARVAFQVAADPDAYVFAVLWLSPGSEGVLTAITGTAGKARTVCAGSRIDTEDRLSIVPYRLDAINGGCDEMESYRLVDGTIVLVEDGGP